MHFYLSDALKTMFALLLAELFSMTNTSLSIYKTKQNSTLVHFTVTAAVMVELYMIEV